ncbi:glycosyltransferase family 4 protein [Actinomadura kijaniata]|uniref:Phosphatidylinositol alpha-1,6-mannosyltransferase n=1 Tax=Actinomadura namibiensis TaxID=182080 RepID=A0A7W3LIF9_ACTNM|nr:glycosyltransferase family 4 protein [Actinomadura namibiensis]MBA8948739.1 phosphatidylinositol alpha-1,6-mannosyltransferase [Actinomadura namibiensis]
MRCLIVTNDFPPRRGGIETFVYEMARRFPAGEVVVYTSREEGDAAFDAGLAFPVVRDPARTLLPTRRVVRNVRRLLARYGCDRVWFGAAAPLGLMAGRIGVPSVATTHGHEVWWASVPGARQVLRRIGERADVVTYLTDDTRRRMARAWGPGARLERLVPGVDADLFRPGDGSGVREHLGLGDRPVILSVSRLVARKGQDRLVRAMPLVRAAVPDATLLIVGDGPQEFWLRGLAGKIAPGGVVFAGGRPHAELPPFYAAADVFAMPCRDRRLGLETEGLGIVFLEAQAAGLPVLAGRSGGAPEAVRDGETGFVVDDDVRRIADRLVTLLTDPGAMGAKGRAWVRDEWSWDRSHDRLRHLLGTCPTVAP